MTTSTSPSDDFLRLVQEARHLRDYLVRAGATTHDRLSRALEPLENGGEVSAETRQEFYRAFQAAIAETSARTDEFTLSEVLQGRAYRFRSAKGLGAIAVAFAGFLLVLTSYLYTNWIGRTTYPLTNAEQYVSFDHFSEVIRLVELSSYFEGNMVELPESTLEPQMVYLEGENRLAAHYELGKQIQGELFNLRAQSELGRLSWNWVKRRLCGVERPLEEQNGFQLYLSCKPKAPEGRPATDEGGETPSGDAAENLAALEKNLDPEAGLGDGEASGQFLAAASVRSPPAATEVDFLELLNQVKALIDEAIENAAGEDVNANFYSSILQVKNHVEEIRTRIDTIQRWYLPMIYGSLGCIVYCIWRILSPTVAALPLGHVALRIAFAALAAMTLSMLLVPSNSLAVGANPGTTLVYLLAFLFGYSIEVFVNTLRNLNQYMSSSLAPKTREAAG